eukprot:980450-Pleurochrysis_carterae.AAC.1
MNASTWSHVTSLHAPLAPSQIASGQACLQTHSSGAEATTRVCVSDAVICQHVGVCSLSWLTFDRAPC